MANNAAQRIRATQLDGAIRSAVGSTGTKSFSWIPIFLGLILRSNG
jgi:hypothetical protein